MGIVQLPAGWERGDGERSALERGLAKVLPVRSLRVLPMQEVDQRGYCAGCARPIEFGAVVRGDEVFCSIDCSLGGGRPA
jgi:hypothetical protein